MTPTLARSVRSVYSSAVALQAGPHDRNPLPARVRVPLGPAEIGERSSERALVIRHDRAARAFLERAGGRTRLLRPPHPMAFRQKHAISAGPNGTRLGVPILQKRQIRCADPCGTCREARV